MNINIIPPPPPSPRGSRGNTRRRVGATLAAALAATVMAAPVAAQSNLTKPKVWIEYKGPQVLDACDPGMPSTQSAVNVEAHGGFFEPGSSYTSFIQARVAFTPNDVLEVRRPGETTWDDLGQYPNGQIRITIQKGDNIILFRQKGSSYAPMPPSERRVVRVNLLTSCSDCPGAPGGPPITSSLQVGVGSVTTGTYTVDEGESCRSPDHAGPTFSHTEIPMNGCRVRVRDGETYRWQDCNTTIATDYCYAVPDRISDPVCESVAKYSCEPPETSAWQTRTSDTTYQVKNSGTVFNVQYNGYGCD